MMKTFIYLAFFATVLQKEDIAPQPLLHAKSTAVVTVFKKHLIQQTIDLRSAVQAGRVLPCPIHLKVCMQNDATI